MSNKGKGSVHTDLFGPTDAQKTLNCCEDLHDGFRANLSGNSILHCKTPLSARVFFFSFHVALTNVQFDLHWLN